MLFMNFLLKISGSGNRFLLADKRHFDQNRATSPWEDFILSDYKFEDFLKLAKQNPSEREKFLKNLMAKAPLADGLLVLDSSPLRTKESELSNPNSNLTKSELLNQNPNSHLTKSELSNQNPDEQKTDKSLTCSFYNKDGSTASMCGNAACCLSFYIEELGLGLKKFFFDQEEILLAQKGGIVIKKALQNSLDFTQPFPFSFIDTGVPHGVIECSELDFKDPKNPIGTVLLTTKLAPFEDFKKPIKSLALKLRPKNINKYKEGMNVSFYQVLSPKQLKAITFERGVEDWTLACGTGALAVFLVHLSKNKSQKSLEVQMPGGILKIESGEHLKLFSQVKKGF